MYLHSTLVMNIKFTSNNINFNCLIVEKIVECRPENSFGSPNILCSLPQILYHYYVEFIFVLLCIFLTCNRKNMNVRD